jgi:polyhydroxyalkanoate synthesis regulator phasin
MPDREKPGVATVTPPAALTPPPVGVPGTVVPPKRSPGHRGADVKDTVAEMAAKAHEISLEAGSKMAAAMKDVIGAAAGLTGLVLESARDLLQYMVRRGQMTQEEADKLMREVEASHAKRKPATPAAHAAPRSAPSAVSTSHAPTHHAPSTHHAHSHHAPSAHHAASTHHATPAVKHAAKPAAKHAAPARKPTAKKPTMKPAAKKRPIKSATKSKPKGSGKTAKKR